jgi:hypothetical protein
LYENRYLPIINTSVQTINIMQFRSRPQHMQVDEFRAEPLKATLKHPCHRITQTAPGKSYLSPSSRATPSIKV